MLSTPRAHRALTLVLLATLGGCGETESTYELPSAEVIPERDASPVIAQISGHFDGENFFIDQIEPGPELIRAEGDLGVVSAELTERLDAGTFGTGVTGTGTEMIALEQVARHAVTPGLPSFGDWAANASTCGPVPAGSESGVCVQIRMRNLFTAYEVIHGHVALTSLTANPPTTSVSVPPPAPDNQTAPVDPFYIDTTPAGGGLWRYGAVQRSTPALEGPVLSWVFRGTTTAGSRFSFSFQAEVRGDLVSPIGRGDLVASSTDLPPAYGMGTPGDQPASSGPVDIDATGRYVFFTSSATNLVAGTTTAIDRVYRKDMETGSVILVSVTSTAAVPQDCASRNPSAGQDGFWVAFESDCALSPADANGVSDVYLRDVRRVGPILISNAVASAAAANGPSTNPVYAAPYVIYESHATNLTSYSRPAGRTLRDVYYRNIGSSAAIPISIASPSVWYNADSFVGGVASSGGSAYILLNTAATNAVAADTNGVMDVILVSTSNGHTQSRTRISVSETGAQLAAASLGTSVSADGRYAAWQSDASGILGGSSGTQVYVRDRTGGPAALERASVSPTGAAGNGNSTQGVLSGDGRFVAFGSTATNLLVTPAAGTHLYVYDRGSLEPDFDRAFAVSVSEAFAPGSGTLGGLSALSADGNYVVFSTDASLVPGASGMRVYRGPAIDLRTQ